jgi:hypothetical protein
VTLGAGLGGAAASIALAVGGPFLPQAFVVILRGGAYDGNPETYRRLGQPLALRLAERNPDLLTIQHYDPVHDEWMTRYANHLRFKLLDLPAAYRDFLRARLEPGGAVVYLDSGASWLRYRLGARSFFQVGGWGDISAQEFIASSPRLRAYAQRVGLTRHAWGLRDYPLETGPESEWGTEPGLGAALERFCAAEGYRFVPIHLPEPHDFSRLAFTAAAARLAAAGRPPAGVLIEMFTQFDPYAALQADLLPLWLIFNTHDSLEFLQSMRPSFPPAAPVFFSPLATFTPTPDLTPFAAWEAALAGTDWRSIGARPSHYPADAAALSHWQEPLRAWAAAHAQPPTAPLAAETLAALAAALPPAGAA